MFKKLSILITILALHLFANDYNNKIIIKVNSHEHYVPDSLSKQLYDTFTFYKDSIEEKLIDKITTDFTVGKVEFGPVISNIRFLKTGTDDEFDLYLEVADNQLTVGTTWQATLVNIVLGMFGMSPDPTFLHADVDLTANFYIYARARVYTDTMLVSLSGPSDYRGLFIHGIQN